MNIIWKKDEVPEWVPEGELVELGDGRVHLKVDPEGTLQFGDVKPLKDALGTERENLKAVRDQLKASQPVMAALESAGTSIEDLLDAHSKVSSDWKPPADTAEAVEQALAKQKAQYEGKLGGLTEKLTKQRQSEEERVLRDHARRSLKEAGFKEDDFEFLEPVILSSSGIYRDDQDRIHVRIVDEHGNPRMSQRGTSHSDMQLSEFATDVMLKDSKYQRFVAASDASGTGDPDITQPIATEGVRVIPSDRDPTVEEFEMLQTGKAVRSV